jgi:hypothetical protein
MGADQYPETVSDSDDFSYELTDEITEDFWGHVCPIGAGPRSRLDPRYAAGPMNFDRYAAMAGTGGVLCYGHPHGPLGDGEDLEAVAKLGMGHVAREFPVEAPRSLPLV